MGSRSASPARHPDRWLVRIAAGVMLAGLLLAPLAAQAQTPQPASGKPTPVSRLSDGQIVRDAQGNSWVIDGGKRHLVQYTEAPEELIQAMPIGDPAGALKPIVRLGAEGQPPYTFTGSNVNQFVTESFWLNPGAVTFRVKQDGSGNFSLWFGRADLYDAAQNYLPGQLVFNTYGRLQDAAAVASVAADDAGAHVMQITASGSWEVVVDQPPVVNPASLPQRFSGKGIGITPYFQAKAGPIRVGVAFTAPAGTTTSVVARLVDQSGAVVGEIARSDFVPQFETAAEGTVPDDGPYLVSIELGGGNNADTTWSVSVQQ